VHLVFAGKTGADASQVSTFNRYCCSRVVSDTLCRAIAKTVNKFGTLKLAIRRSALGSLASEVKHVL
jgi:hypothetical protein